MFDLTTVISTVGILGIVAIIFAESGLLIGFFLPGDSLLIAAGLFAAGGHLNLWILLPLTIIAAIAGDSVGYATGKTFGPKVFKKDEYVERTKLFFKKHGSFAVILARFVPIVRTFTPVMAGVGKMDYKTFFFYNCVGGIGWATGLLGLSFLAGTFIPGISGYVDYIVIGVVVLSLIPLLKHTRRA